MSRVEEIREPPFSSRSREYRRGQLWVVSGWFRFNDLSLRLTGQTQYTEVTGALVRETLLCHSLVHLFVVRTESVSGVTRGDRQSFGPNEQDV